jgi:hypothetical protein
MQLESEKVTCSAPVSEIYSFLSSDFANYRAVMPEDVEHFESDDTSFVFGMKGVPHIRLISKENTPNERIVLTAASSKLDFDLTLHLKEENGGSLAYFQFEGDFNPMMQMMIKKPLQSFIDKLINQIKSRFSS